MHFVPLVVILLLSAALSLQAEDPLPNVERLQSSPVLRHLRPNPMPQAPRTGPEQTLAQMYVPEGFRVDLVAAEPDLQQPIAFAFDERGRIWVAEAYSYPQKQPAGQGGDKLVIFSDNDGDGRFESRRVFAEGLNLVSGFELGYGGVWVGAAPELLFIPDRNRDDVPDGPPQVLLTGFGYQDTHECLNSFLWGPDGWLYGIQGVFNYARIGKPNASDDQKLELRAGVWRYHPTRHEFEIFAHGGSNPWGLDYDQRGQLFMTHCRSYFGRGLTTHVIQGGQFWNQANANYAPYIIAEPPPEYPAFRNYLLASARYDHGAGGAGAPGTDAIYGGHSHVGTMIYLGDNWPAEYRGHLFTHNLHGHQINQQVNRRLGSGFDTVHAGRDLFFCSDPKYVAVDLQCGPDGAVYSIDWYDQQHCHNPNTERWDRSNGRLYRMQWQAGYHPVRVDLSASNDLQLVSLHRHPNEWFGRTARRLLAERAQTRPLDPDALRQLENFSSQDPDPGRRLSGLWSLHSARALAETARLQALADPDEYVRAWAIQLSVESPKVSGSTAKRLAELARLDPSPVVRLYLASASQRLPDETAWPILEALSQHGEDREDRNLPQLLWHSLAPRLPTNLERSLALADRTLLPQLTDWIVWYAARQDGVGLQKALTRLSALRGDDQRRLLTAVTLAVENMPASSANAAGTNAPKATAERRSAWDQVAAGLYASKDLRVVRQAERLAGIFGDNSMFPRLRATLGDSKADLDSRKHAFGVLSRALDQESLPVFLSLLDQAAFRSMAIRLLARFDSAEVPPALLRRYESFPGADRAGALNTLMTRASFALALLDGVAAGQVKRDQLTAFHVRQLTQLHNPEVDRRVTATWGKFQRTAGEKQARIDRLEKIFQEAPLWAFDGGGAGRAHFQKLCAQCHRLRDDGVVLGPELTGAGKNGVRYFLENIIDPNAVIGTDFQMTTVETRKGDVISGIVVNDAPTVLTLRTTVEQVAIPKADIAQRTTSESSLMPEGLLESLNEREQIELLKYLTSN
ncbi:MAG TPA: PVC-type heme-binding CxxCH protein [Verrucomicrobiae bacterium]|nr:PVC-type heme-binding CxxCH protein [Verrucomicrobiae bacterium]